MSGTTECSADNAGAAGAQALCKVGEFDTVEAAKIAYVAARNHALKALPQTARGAEQNKVSPTIPVRFVAAVDGKAVVVVLTQEPQKKWLVGYLFQKMPG